MKIKKKCDVCKKDHWAIKETQRFCCRKCFKRDYYVRTKKKIKEEEANPVFPNKKCTFCNKMAKLTFDPLKFPKLFDSFSCPDCKVTNTMIWDHSDEPNSRQKILNIIKTSVVSDSTSVEK